MARESVEGQAMELHWVKHRYWTLRELDYLVMTRKKTCWYTCITPCRLGAIIGSKTEPDLPSFARFGFFLGIAFQIQDDLLNLVGNEDRYGKEIAGDIWEGKRTIMLIHLLNSAVRSDRRDVTDMLAKPRASKTQEEISNVLALMEQYGSIERGRELALLFAEKAGRIFESRFADLADSPHKEFLRGLVDFVLYRDL
jgi:geranylgeranyl diphosphate synthase type II